MTDDEQKFWDSAYTRLCAAYAFRGESIDLAVVAIRADFMLAERRKRQMVSASA